MGRRLLYRRNGWPRPAAVQEEHCVAARAAPNQVDGAVLAGPELSFSEKVMVPACLLAITKLSPLFFFYCQLTATIDVRFFSPCAGKFFADAGCCRPAADAALSISH